MWALMSRLCPLLQLSHTQRVKSLVCLLMSHRSILKLFEAKTGQEGDSITSEIQGQGETEAQLCLSPSLKCFLCSVSTSLLASTQSFPRQSSTSVDNLKYSLSVLGLGLPWPVKRLWSWTWGPNSFLPLPSTGSRLQRTQP